MSKDGMETAWGIIANAHGGNWNLATDEWRTAAERWRDEVWHPSLSSEPTPARKPEGLRERLEKGLDGLGHICAAKDAIKSALNPRESDPDSYLRTAQRHVLAALSESGPQEPSAWRLEARFKDAPHEEPDDWQLEYLTDNRKEMKTWGEHDDDSEYRVVPLYTTPRPAEEETVPTLKDAFIAGMKSCLSSVTPESEAFTEWLSEQEPK